MTGADLPIEHVLMELRDAGYWPMAAAGNDFGPLLEERSDARELTPALDAEYQRRWPEIVDWLSLQAVMAPVERLAAFEFALDEQQRDE